MNQREPSGNIAPSKPLGGPAKFCLVAWIAATLVVYFVAFGTRYVVSLFGRLGLDTIGGWFQQLNQGLMMWFSNKGG